MNARLIVALLFIPLAQASAREHFACNAAALAPAERLRHQELSKTLLGAVLEKVELKDGYGLRLAAEHFMNAAEWVSLERRCCPFFTFVLEQGRDQGPLWLRMTGSEGIKPFIRIEFRL